MIGGRYVTDIRPYLGTDPELFLASGNKIVGSERLVGETGFSDSYSTVVPDGVQIELHPSPSTCRQSLASFLANSLDLVRRKMDEVGGMSVNFEAVVKVSQEELDALSDKSKVFGCAKSENIYDMGADVKINAATYLKRHAGGHIHLGLENRAATIYARGWNGTDAGAIVTDHRKRLVPLLDAFVGNTCVLLDRNPEAVERRKHYGRAGEYRLPKHGLEYRTLSNFWLRSYPLMSFVFGIARQPVGILSDTLGGYNFEAALLGAVDQSKVQQAINNNDVDLAWENFEGVEKFITDHVYPDHTGLSIRFLKPFKFFAKKIQEEGLQYWFPEDPLKHWCAYATPDLNRIPRGYGWEEWVSHVVIPRQNGQ